MLTKAPWMKLLLIVLFPTAVLVLLTSVFENNTLALFPTHDAGGVHGFVRRTGYGLPFAFREVESFIDTSSVHYHWGIFVLNVALISIAIVGLACLKAFAKS